MSGDPLDVLHRILCRTALRGLVTREWIESLSFCQAATLIRRYSNRWFN